MKETLTRVFGFSSFRPGQEQVCEALLAGRSALAVFPTGGGKSICYQLPALILPGTTLVVSPLLALMREQVAWLQARGVAAARLDSTLTAEESRATFEGLSRGELKLLYVAPERFLNERFLERLKRAQISLLAIDEAHCISQWGHNFRPDYLKLARHARELAIPRVLALTATATPPVVEDIAAAFGIAPRDRVLTGFYRPNLELDFVPVSTAERDRKLLTHAFTGPSIVYVTLQKTAEAIAERLRAVGVDARAYHAGMEDPERQAIQDAFMSGAARVIVATIAFGMGIDKADIRAVIHYNLPKTLENYAQEIGRAGRDGSPAVCRMLACRDDVPPLTNFAYGDTPTLSAVAGVVGALFRDAECSVSYRALSGDHDIRELVVKTLVTYLELDGFLRRGTPEFTEYEWRFLTDADTILAGFDSDRRDFLASVFRRARHGRVLHTLDLTAAAQALGDRSRIIRALDYLAEKGHISLKAKGVRERIAVERRPEDLLALARLLHERFLELESREVGRVRELVAFIEGDACHTQRLVAYFGESIGPCGHCTHCRSGAVVLPPPSPPRPRPDVQALRDAHPVLGEPRVLARFLCGVSSPALSKARLTSHAMFGAAAEHDFRDVMGWV